MTPSPRRRSSGGGGCRCPATSSSSQDCRRGQARARASWASSKVSCSEVTSRARTRSPTMRSRSGSPSRLRLDTRQRTGSPSRVGVTSRSRTERSTARWSPRQGVVEAVRGAGDGAPDAAGGPVALDGQDVAVAAPPGLGQRVGQQGKAAGFAFAVPHQQLDQPVFEAEPGQLGGLFDRLAQRVTREWGDQVQALFGEATEAGFGAEAADVVAAHGDDRPAPPRWRGRRCGGRSGG